MTETGRPMTKKPRITIPDTSRNQDAGITYKDGIAYARYTENGKQRRRSIGCDATAHANIRIARDSIYRQLLAAGATVTSKGPKPKDLLRKRRERAAKDPMAYIRHEPKVTSKPWAFRLGSTVLGRYPSVTEARAARDKKLRI